MSSKTENKSDKENDADTGGESGACQLFSYPPLISASVWLLTT